MRSKNPLEMLKAFNRFKKQIVGLGTSPKAMVQDLLNSGKMTQRQYEQLRQQAKAYREFLK